jgi:Kef-type K+ transport system membrane component KefB
MAEPTAFVLQLSILLVAAIAGGLLIKRFGYPVALGELLVGIILGPSIFNLISDEATVSVFAELGAIILLFYIGLETEMGDLRKQLLPSISVGVLGAIVPLVICYYTALAFGISNNEALFLGVVFTATSIGITIRLLKDMGKLNNPLGLTVLGAGIVDDVVAVILLSVVLSMLSGGVNAYDIGGVIVKAIAFWAIIVLIGSKILLRIIDRVHLDDEYFILFLLAYGFLASYIAAAIGLSAIVGAFAAGLPLTKKQIKIRMVLEQTKSLYMFFVPIFFISIGTLINLSVFGQAAVLGLIITVMAFAGKIIGSFLGARINKFSVHDSLRIGVSMTPRGEMGLIIASLGLTSGLISTKTYSIGVMAVILTTFIALPILKKVLCDKKIPPPPSKEEPEPPVEDHQKQEAPALENPPPPPPQNETKQQDSVG